jgi:pilus assembly protein CpaC
MVRSPALPSIRVQKAQFKLGLAALLCAGMMLQPLPVRADEPGEPRMRSASDAVLQRMRVTVNKSRTTRLDFPFQDVMVGSSEIADVIPISDQTLYVLGKKIGTTNISVFDRDRKLLAVIDVEVGIDVALLEARIHESTGNRDIRVRGFDDKVVLSGLAGDAQTVDRAFDVASGLVGAGVVNTTRVTSPQQVMLKVRFVEVQRDAGREFGVRLEYAGERRNIRSGPIGAPSIVNSGADAAGGGTAGPLAVLSSAVTGNAQFAQIFTTLADKGNQIDAFINALENKGLVRRLGEPNLIAMSGDTANFLAGGEFPVPVNSTTANGFPNVTIAFKEYGVGLAFTPTVLRNGLINLRIEPEVSELDPTTSVRVGGVEVPGLVKRRAKTTVELRDGQSFAIAGLIQAQSQRTVEQLPWLGSIPVLGALFRSSAFQQRETELVVIVTPHLVQPARPGRPLATPFDASRPANDPDLFLEGKVETPDTKNRERLADKARGLGAHGHMIEAQPAAAKTTARSPAPSAPATVHPAPPQRIVKP